MLLESPKPIALVWEVGFSPLNYMEKKVTFSGKKGGEFGATTGRPRRCDWLDIPLLNYAIKINGVTQIAMTKVDVLEDMGDISVANSYTLDGEEIKGVPFDLDDPGIASNYHSLPGWTATKKMDPFTLISRTIFIPLKQNFLFPFDIYLMDLSAKN